MVPRWGALTPCPLLHFADIEFPETNLNIFINP